MRVLKEHSILRVNIAVFMSQKRKNIELYIFAFLRLLQSDFSSVAMIPTLKCEFQNDCVNLALCQRHAEGFK